METTFSVPGVDLEDGARLGALLQGRLDALIDLHLTLKHIHWNVVGPSFQGVHELMDTQVISVRLMADDVAERIASLGGQPSGTPAAIVGRRSWDDYDVGRGTTQEHLSKLDAVYSGVIGSHREALDAAGEIDAVTEDLLIGQTGQLERFQWFVRAHLERPTGEIVHKTSPQTSAVLADSEQRIADGPAGAVEHRTSEETVEPDGN